MCVKVLKELFACDDPIERKRVRNSVQRIIPIREQDSTIKGLEARVAAGPFLRDKPRQAFGSGGIFTDNHRSLRCECLECRVVAIGDDVAWQPPERGDHLAH